MNADRLFTHYDRVADAPDAVDRLRRFVLDLAVRGKLVEQDPADAPASELAALRGPDGTVSSSNLPASWHRAHIGDILDFRYGKGLKVSDRMDAGPVPVYGSNGIVGYTDKSLTTRPSVIVGRKGSAGALNKCDGPSWTTDVAFFVEVPGFLDLDFLYLSLVAVDLNDLAKGVKPGLSRVDAYRQAIGVPPLAEQRRIVAKVDELMALCDRLEENCAARQDARDRLTTATLTRLTAPETDTLAFRSHARFAIHALPALTARADQVKQLRQTILSLAVRGKLVEQDSTEEAASVLLKRIDSARRLAPTQGRKTKGAAIRSSLADTAFALPAGWARARLSQLVGVLNGRAYKRAELLDSGTPVLRVGNLFTSKHWYYSDLQLAEDKYCDEGDLLYAWSASFGPVIWQGPRVIFHYHIWKLSLFSEADLDKRFLYYLLLQQTQEIKSAGHGVSMVHMTKGKMERLPVPLPPLAEQHRIVATVDALMALCDQLEAGLDATGGTRNRLLESLLQDTLTSSAYEAAVVGAISA